MRLEDVSIDVDDDGAAVEAWDAEAGELVRFRLELPAAPFSAWPGLRSAYQRGFARRVKEITGAREEPNEVNPFKRKSHVEAWQKGRDEADQQAAARVVVEV